MLFIDFIGFFVFSWKEKNLNRLKWGARGRKFESSLPDQ
jgi:hypothetical protein